MVNPSVCCCDCVPPRIPARAGWRQLPKVGIVKVDLVPFVTGL
jgi:hypothetical protein